MEGAPLLRPKLICKHNFGSFFCFVVSNNLMRISLKSKDDDNKVPVMEPSNSNVVNIKLNSNKRLQNNRLTFSRKIKKFRFDI